MISTVTKKNCYVIFMPTWYEEEFTLFLNQEFRNFIWLIAQCGT